MFQLQDPIRADPEVLGSVGGGLPDLWCQGPKGAVFTGHSVQGHRLVCDRLREQAGSR